MVQYTFFEPHYVPIVRNERVVVCRGRYILNSGSATIDFLASVVGASMVLASAFLFSMPSACSGLGAISAWIFR